MIDSFTSLKLKAANGSSPASAAVSCGAIRDYYLSKGNSLSIINGNLFHLFYMDGTNKVTYQTVCLFDETMAAWALALDLKDGSDSAFSYASQYWTNNATVGTIGSQYTNLKTVAFAKHVAHSLRMSTTKTAFIVDSDGFIVATNKTNIATFRVHKKTLVEAFSDESSPSRVIPGSLRTARSFYALAPDYTSAKYCANKLVGFNMGNSNYLRVRFGVVTSSNASCSENGRFDAYIGIGGSETGAYHGMGGKGTNVCSHPRRKLAYKYACESAAFATSSLYVGDQFDCRTLGYCSGHGICAGTNLCLCEDGITTANCSLSCNPSCKHGTCIGTNKCECDAGWSGPLCDEPSCFGKLINDSSVCSSRGDCIGLDTCSCRPGFYGNDCQFSKCNGKFSNDSSACHYHGNCLEMSGVCNCTTGFYGNDCEIWKCFGVLSNETTCSGHGSCDATDNCTCDVGFFGQDCYGSLFTCFGISASNHSVCSGMGSCIGQDTCSCDNSTLYGERCEMLKCNGKMMNDSTVCSSEGQCIYGVCHCNSTFYGIDCELKKCNGKSAFDPTVCSSNGTCVSGVCNCSTTNYGNDCQFIKCNGKTAENSTVCSSAGQCFSGVCNCNSTSYGNDCQYLKCNGKTGEDPTVCSSNGNCVIGVCNCNKNYTGNDCQHHTCNGTIFSSNSVCSGRGSCVSVNNCSCLLGFYGENCEFIISGTVTCYGVASLSPLACSGNGYCVGQQNCTCKQGYAGNECERILCHGMLSNSSSVCSSKGVCIAPDTCSCNNGYTGSKCDIPICYGILASDTRVCSESNGTCTAPNTCSCKSGYAGNQCETPVCFTKVATDPSVCSGGGICSAPNTCICPSATATVKVTGNQCQFLQCLGNTNAFFISTDSRVCSGRGSCTQLGCQCKTGYSGNYCQIYTCNNSRFDQNDVCSGHGNCTDYNTCACNQNDQDGFWKGTYCDACRGDYETEATGCKKLICDPVTTCNQHGSCVELKCVCNGNWDGKFCSYCTTNYYDSECGTYCEKSTTCSNHGECTNNGTCACYSNDNEGYWEGSSCNKCQLGWYGSRCSTQIIGPAKFLDMFNGIVFKVIGPVSYTQLKVNCSRLISGPQLALFGVGPVCRWTNRENAEFTILFGDDSTLIPGAIIKMNRFAFDATGEDLQDVNVLNADSPVTPVVVFSGSNNIGTCDNFTLDASASYSGDRKPLRYYWHVVSSPNNFLSVHMPNASIINIDYITLQQPGEYKFGLQVESSISGKVSALSVWTVSKADVPLPVLRIIGYTEKAIIKYESPVVIKKHLELPVCFYPNQELNVVWEQLSGPETSSETDNFKNLAITHFSGLVESTYEFKVTATSVVNPLSTASDTIKIVVKPSPLSLILYSDEVSSEEGTIVVNFVDPDTTSETETWSWSCFDDTNKVDCGSLIENALATAAVKRNPRPIISSTDIKVYTSMPTLKLTLGIVKGIRSVQTTLDFVFPESKKVPPTVTLISVVPTKTIILKQEIVNLQLAVTANGEAIGIDQYIRREWSFNSDILSGSEKILSMMIMNPTLSNSIVIDPASLEDGATYTITLKVTDIRNGLSASYSHIFQVAAPPQACPCTISPSAGVALETSFSFTCINCQNAQKTLKLVYGFIDDKSGANIPLYQNGEVYSTKLPCSYTPITNKIVTTYIRITDTSTGAFTEIKKDITIDLAPVKSVVDVKKKVASYNTIQNSLKDGDTAKMVFNSATISRTSEGMLAKLSYGNTRRRENKLVCKNGGTLIANTDKCKCLSGFAKEDCGITSEDFTAYQEIRLSLMEDFIKTFAARNPYEIITETYLTLQAYGLDSLIEKYDELDQHSMDKSVDIVNTLLRLCEYNKDLRVPYGVDKLLTNILNSIYKYIKYNELGATEQLSSLFTLFKRISGLMLRGIFVGERDLQLKTNFASLSTNKLFRAGYESRMTSPTNGALVLLPPEMPHYLTEKSNRRTISFVSISSSDIFGIAQVLYKSEILSDTVTNVNSSTVSTVISSTRYLRSDVLFFELIDSTVDSILTPISYNLTTIHVKNYPSNTLISSTKSKELNNNVVINVYSSSDYICRTFTNFTIGIDPSCVVIMAENSIASCRCQSATSTLILEIIVEKVVKISTSIAEDSLGIILGVVLGLSCALCILLALCVILIVVGCRCRKRKKRVIPEEEDVIPEDHAVELHKIESGIVAYSTD